ncbi:FG-GAP-like repeat-containing protein [Streptomyces sp. VRA16 Mangrove soil]|uniref:FG-GAP-like repeat-containing protein n=1 Tax=Streptomyces sp. VRA16 Mangrove soil TaxID=2817434 RepID=UPI001A9E80CB|nr:FG-GAP-like repeat-containing protein [Streptomyces sp. VRA16 Mangrove soil]MBO1337137.1 FG-GAP repeat protein [Streptomyces sp. VRA16 Mangrove soil]
MPLPRRTVVAVTAVTALTGGLLAVLPAATAGAAPAKLADDFNGDGHRDLAIGAPYKTVGGATAAGAVVVSFGSASGLTTQQVTLTQSSTGVPGTPEEGDYFGISMAGGDLDGDGYADLVVGADGEDVDGIEGQGSVTVLWGGTKPFTTSTTTTVQNPSTWQAHGSDVAVGDFTGDSGADLAVIESGAVVIYPGGLTRDSKPVPAYSLSVSGASLLNSQAAVGDVNGDGKDDLAVTGNAGTGRPGTDVFTGQTGRPYRIQRVDDGNTAVALGDINGDGYDDMATSLTWPDFYDVADPSHGSGYVTVRYGSATGFGDPVVLHQDSTGVPGVDEDGDNWGASVAIGDITGDGKAELVVGANGEQLGDLDNAGDVTVFRGTASGVSQSGVVRISQDTANVPGAAEAGDLFGAQVRIADYDNNGKGDLAVTASFENDRSGGLWTLPGTSSGLTGTGSQSLSAADFGLTSGSRLGETMQH